MSVKIREMVEHDAARIAELEKICFSRPWSEQALLETMRSGQSIFYVADEGEVMGYVGMTYAADEGEITDIAVFPEGRRKGIGEALLNALDIFAMDKGLANIFLDVRVSNAPAIALYSKMGYENCGVRKRFYDLPAEDGYVYKKSIFGE